MVPLPIKGIELRWEGSYLPRNSSVHFAGANHEYQEANVPDLDYVDLTMDFSIPEIIGALGEIGKGTTCRNIILQGQFKKEFGETLVRGNDYVRISN